MPRPQPGDNRATTSPVTGWEADLAGLNPADFTPEMAARFDRHQAEVTTPNARRDRVWQAELAIVRASANLPVEPEPAEVTGDYTAVDEEEAFGPKTEASEYEIQKAAREAIIASLTPEEAAAAGYSPARMAHEPGRPHYDAAGKLTRGPSVPPPVVYDDSLSQGYLGSRPVDERTRGIMDQIHAALDGRER